MKTLEIFDQTVEFLRTVDLGEDELRKSIIGTIGDIDRHLLPDAKGYTSMIRHLTDDTEEKRQQVREEVLRTSATDFRAFADFLEGVKENGLVKVIGSSSAIESAAAERDGWLDVVKLL